jgi:outer membrane receptor protein involved in Fe transport
MTLYDGTRFYVGASTLTFPFDSWSADKIEVLRGPASVLYGEGAIGGAINVIPKNPLSVQSNELDLWWDTNNTKRIAIDSGGPINNDVTYELRPLAASRTDGSITTTHPTQRSPQPCVCSSPRISPGSCRRTFPTADRLPTTERR